MFDWEVPALGEPYATMFFVRIIRPGSESSIRFRLDWSKLTQTDQQKLFDSLAALHAGLDDRHPLLRSIEWMLGLSLEQTAPYLTKIEREFKVRKELLSTEP
jgi:hypothetical protein